jgi:predicted GNAT superfamily acetyltransferase
MVLLPGADYGSPNYEFFCERLDNFVYLDRVAVTKNFQGIGIGAALYREVEMKTDAEWFALEVNTKPRNEGSLRFHAREGFVQMEELETRPGKMVSLMVKKLKG